MVKLNAKWWLVPLMVASLNVAAFEEGQTFYVTDVVRLSVRDQPKSGARSLVVVESGAPLVVTGKANGNFLPIRTNKGIEGWVTHSYLVTEPTHNMRLEALQGEMDTQQQQMAELRQQFAALNEAQQQLLQERDTLEREAADLRAKQESFDGVRRALEAERQHLLQRINDAWPWLGGAGLVIFLFGIYMGGRRYRRRVNRRFGGLEL
jgi:SH3 domain protein